MAIFMTKVTVCDRRFVSDSNEVVMSTCLHLFLSVFALGA
jgi:hypothetical protein